MEDASVSVRVAEGDDVTVRTTPGPDGLVRLPAIAEGPFRAVRVSVPGVGVAVLLNVSVGENPLEVRLSRQSGRLVALVASDPPKGELKFPAHWQNEIARSITTSGADNDEVYTFALVHDLAAGVVVRF